MWALEEAAQSPVKAFFPSAIPWLTIVLIVAVSKFKGRMPSSRDWSGEITQNVVVG